MNINEVSISTINEMNIIWNINEYQCSHEFHNHLNYEYLPMLAQSPWLEPWLEPLQFRMTTSCDDKSEKNEKT